MTGSEILINDMNGGTPERDAYGGVLMGKNREDEKATYITRRSALAGLILIGGGIMMAGNEGIRGFFGTLFNYGNLSDSYHEMSRTSHDPDIRFGNFSPDGTKVVLNYRPMVNNDDRISYIGILKIATGELQLIRPPKEYRMWYDGSFSPDGKNVAFVYTLNNKVEKHTGIGILNIESFDFKSIYMSKGGRTYLSFSPDGNRLIYFKEELILTKYGEKSRGNDVYEMDLAAKKENRLTRLNFFKGRAAPRYFPEGDNYIFAAESPYLGSEYTEERKQRENKHREQYKDNDTYIFNRNTIAQAEAVPSIIYKDISYFVDMSHDGKKILCIARSHLHKTATYNYDLFLYEDNQMRQLTDFQWMIIDAALSPDGRKAIFVADTTPSRGSERKLYRYNLETNTATPIEIKLEKIVWRDAGKPEVQS